MSEAVPVKKIMIFIAINSSQHQHSQLQPIKENPRLDQDSVGNNPNDQSQNSSGIGTANGSTAAVNAKDQTTNNTTLDLNSTQRDNLIHNNLPQQQQQQANPTSPVKQQPANKNNGPLEVVIVSTAKVQDLIGLICWQYTNEGREPKLHSDINRYCLRIAEDNGEVDPDFSSLNPREPLSKFNFPSLALTEKTEEKVRTYNEHQYANGSIYNHRAPSMSQNVTSGIKLSSTSKGLAALTRFIFKDAKLNSNQ